MTLFELSTEGQVWLQSWNKSPRLKVTNKKKFKKKLIKPKRAK